jgi:hypothetical protein
MTALVRPFAILLVALCGSAAAAEPWSVYLLRGSEAVSEAAQMTPGEHLRFTVASNVWRVGTSTAFPLKEPLTGIRWTIEPPSPGIAISADGTVTAQSTARPGAFNVVATANGESRRKELRVYSPSEEPLVGLWGETADVECGSGKQVAAKTPVRELVFQADGSFSVTWFPFETYRDYVGTYEYARSSGKLTLKPVSFGNYKPIDLRPEGSAKIGADGRLTLGDGMWLGTPRNATTTVEVCGQIFSRR